MDLSPSKRRKTSPNASITVTASNTNSLATKDDGSNAVYPRSSYMSPTKASLARFNPSLLSRAGSVEPPRQAAASATTQRARTEDPANPEPASRIPLNSEDISNGVNGLSGRGSPSVFEDTPSKLPKLPATQQPSVSLQSNGLLSTPNHRRRRRVSYDRDPDLTNEPSLPSTPSQLGLEAPAEKPRGLLFQTSKQGPSLNNNTRSSGNENQADGLQLKADDTKVISLLGTPTIMSARSASSVSRLPHLGRKDRLFRRIETRLVTIQDELTKLSLRTTPPNESGSSKKSRTRVRKQLGQDTRFIRAAISEGIVPGERYEYAPT